MLSIRESQLLWLTCQVISGQLSRRYQRLCWGVIKRQRRASSNVKLLVPHRNIGSRAFTFFFPLSLFVTLHHWSRGGMFSSQLANKEAATHIWFRSLTWFFIFSGNIFHVLTSRVTLVYAMTLADWMKELSLNKWLKKLRMEWICWLDSNFPTYKCNLGIPTKNGLLCTVFFNLKSDRGLNGFKLFCKTSLFTDTLEIM